MTESGGNSPWAWLGLLKWSLSYTDGTRPTSESMTPLSDEDKAFLEAVMKDGIIDENERMKIILKDVTEMMEQWRTITKFTETEAEDVEKLLQELRDIVEQIDYARAFAVMNGLPFLLGCIQESIGIPMSCRILSLGILSTMCQNNPPVQKKMLELGALKTLSDLFFHTTHNDEDNHGKIRAGIIQVISAVVRSNDFAEAIYCQLEQSVPLIEYGIGMNDVESSTPHILRRRTLFFLHAIVTSDTTSVERVDQFSLCIGWIIDTLITKLIIESDYDCLEMILAMIEMLLLQQQNNNGIDVILQRKIMIIKMAQSRASIINAMPEIDREYSTRELELWYSILNSLKNSNNEEQKV